MTIILSILLSVEVTLQHTVICEEAQLSFLTKQQLVSYDTELEGVYGFDNDDIAVDIEVVPLYQESEQFRKDIKYGAKEIAEDMYYNEIFEGRAIPAFKNSFYVMTYDYEEDLKIPVIILAIINESTNKAYEITIFCYNQDQAEGEQIAMSFKPM